jgi:hypothetical protein
MKKNKNGDTKILLVLLGILVVCFVIIGLLFYKYFYAGTSESSYGDRLDGIENYPLSDTLEGDINSIYENSKYVNTVSVDVKGKIIYIIVDFKESVKVDTAKSEAIKALDKIGEENLKFYDVQFILTYSGESENENFPVFGAKSANSLKVVW